MKPGREATPTLSAATFAWLLLLCFGSGCASLVYQVVWLQLLQLVVGSTAISLGVLLATFMTGLCLGSLLLPRVVPSPQSTHAGRVLTRRPLHPLGMYALLELGIAIWGVVIVWAMPLVTEIYRATGGGMTVRVLVAVASLLPPTILMGATLPAIAKSIEATPRGVTRLGYLYGGNIAGAVAGTLLAGFYLLRVYDMAIATYVAAAINVAAGAVALRLAQSVVRRTSPAGTLSPAPPARGSSTKRKAIVYVAIALSGFTALASEVVWTRLLSLVLGATVYAFSLILAAFLVALAIGSGAGAWLTRKARVDSRVALGWCQLLLCGAIAWGAFMLTDVLPFASLPQTSQPSAALRYDLVRALIVVFPAGCLWGAAFPLALASVFNGAEDASRAVGGVYAANTFGAVAGSAAAVVMTATAGSQRTQQLLIVVAALSGTLLLAPWPLRLRAVRPPAIATFAALIAAAWLLLQIHAVPGVLVAYGRHSASWAGTGNIVYAAEGLNAFVAVSRTPSGAPTYHAAGKVQASSEGEDLRLQRLLAHVSHLLPARSKDVLVIGLGAGITAGAVAIAPGVDRLTVVEIERLVPTLSRYFSDYNYDVVNDAKVAVRIDDARHFLATSDETFDVITSDLVDPWVKGTAALFTREFFEDVRRHLRPGGVATMFVQLYLSNAESVRNELATFIDVFPHTLVLGNTTSGRGYDLVVAGQVEPMRIDVDAIEARLRQPEYRTVSSSLRDIGISSAVDLFSTYAGTSEDLRPWLRGASITRDRNLRLQYLAGLGIDSQQSGPIYAGLVRHARFPEQMFTGSADTLRALRTAIDRAIERATNSGGGPAPDEATRGTQVANPQE